MKKVVNKHSIIAAVVAVTCLIASLALAGCNGSAEAVKDANGTKASSTVNATDASGTANATEAKAEGVQANGAITEQQAEPASSDIADDASDSTSATEAEANSVTVPQTAAGHTHNWEPKQVQIGSEYVVDVPKTASNPEVGHFEPMYGIIYTRSDCSAQQ